MNCLSEDAEEAKSYHTYYRIEPDHEILINTVTIYLKVYDIAHVKQNQKGNAVSILEELNWKKKNDTAEATLQTNKGFDKAIIAWVLFLLRDRMKGKQFWNFG